MSLDAQETQFEYGIFGDVVGIISYSGPGGAVMIPDTIEGLPVVSIGDNAFDGESSITSVVTGSQIDYIGKSAFRDCENLVSVSIPPSITAIGAGAFENCSIGT
jgi:hypothetical protein